MKQQLKNITKQAAKQIAQEPLEILKQAREQVAGPPAVENKSQASVDKPITQQEVQQKKAKARSLYTALENELKEIQVRDAQEQQVQQPPEPQKEAKPLAEPPTKRSRRLFGFGQKAQAEKQKTRVEKPLPPSG